MPLDPGIMLNGRYRVESLLGIGGMGAVYRAFDILHDERCAVKEFRLGHLPAGDETRLRVDNDGTRLRGGNKSPTITREKAAEQFLREAKLLAKLNHANLPKVGDYFEAGGSYYLVMSLIEGQDLATSMEINGNQPFPEPQVMAWMTQVLDALEYCHSQGVIHRDLKPANVIVTQDGKTYLVDFGIAKPNDATTKTTVGARATTPGYSPPEQYGQGLTDARSDIYALGAVLYALLTGIEPIEAIDRLTGEDLRPPSEINSTLSAPIQTVIQRAMSLRSLDRYQSIGEMREAILKPSTFSVIRYENKSYSTLEEAVQVSGSGGTISLAAGEYHLQYPLILNHSIRLVGAGKEATSILCDMEGFILRFSGKGILFLEGISLKHEGQYWANILVVEGGEINITRCCFTGGVRDAKKHGGVGILIKGNTVGIIRKSTLENNDWDGIELRDKSKPVLESNVCRNNKGSGIEFLDAASGIVRKNRCEQNGAYGIYVNGRGRPELIDNQCMGNKVKDVKGAV